MQDTSIVPLIVLVGNVKKVDVKKSGRRVGKTNRSVNHRVIGAREKGNIESGLLPHLTSYGTQYPNAGTLAVDASERLVTVYR